MAFRFGPFSFRRVYKMFSRQMTGFRAIVAAAPIFAGIAAHHQLQLQLTVCDSTSKVRKMKKTVSERAVDEFVHDHYVVGLGTGSTCYYAVLHLAELLRVGALQHVSVIPCSESLRALCVSVGIPVTSLNDTDRVDVIIDGADEVDVSLSMLKVRGRRHDTTRHDTTRHDTTRHAAPGPPFVVTSCVCLPLGQGGSGAFLREKMVQNAVGKRVIVVDDSKLVKSLGPGKPLPVEVRQTCPFRDDPACLNAHCRKCDQVTPFSAEHTRRTLEHLPELAGYAFPCVCGRGHRRPQHVAL